MMSADDVTTQYDQRDDMTVQFDRAHVPVVVLYETPAVESQRAQQHTVPH
jgi:hypothetical protein